MLVIFKLHLYKLFIMEKRAFHLGTKICNVLRLRQITTNMT